MKTPYDVIIRPIVTETSMMGMEEKIHIRSRQES